MTLPKKMGYRRRLMPNFTPIGEVPAEKTVTEQKNEKKEKQSVN